MNTQNEIKNALKITAQLEVGKAVIKKVKGIITKTSYAPKTITKLLEHPTADGIIGFGIGYTVDALLSSGLVKDAKTVEKLEVLSGCFKLSSAVMTSDALGVSDKLLGLLDKLSLDKILPESE